MKSITTETQGSLTLTALPNIPRVKPGDNLADILSTSIEQAGLTLQNRDVLVIAQKIVSKAEERYVDLSDVEPSDRAREIAAVVEKDPRFVEVVLSQSDEVVAMRKDALVVAHRLGFVMANAGIDRSNVEQPEGSDRVLLLPENPDASCERLRDSLYQRFGVEVGIVMNDSFGRAWRNGTVGIAIGVAGLPSVVDCVGEPDMFGQALRITKVGFADEIAAAASLLMGQAAEARPAVLMRGLTWSQASAPTSALIRSKDEDLFRARRKEQ